MAVYTLRVLRGTTEVLVQDLGIRPVHVGRAPGCDIVLADPKLSWHHVLLRVEGDHVLVRDLDSSNGTWLGETRLSGEVRVGLPGELRIGTDLRLRLEVRQPEAALAPSWLIEDLDRGLFHPVGDTTVRIGSRPGVDLQLASGPEVLGSLVFSGSEIWLGTLAGEGALAPGENFELQGERFRIVPAPAGRSPTVSTAGEGLQYRLRTHLGVATGPEAELEDPVVGRVHAVSSERRAALLYLLCCQLQEDRASGCARSDRGWCTDEQLAIGVWGRSSRSQEPNNLNVLLHRLRKELAGAGFDPWFIEKRRRAMRLTLRDVSCTREATSSD